MMRSLIFFILSLSLLLTGCNEERSHRSRNLNNWFQKNGKLKVLSTIRMIDDLVEIIGGEQVDHYTLIQGELDPHSYQLIKGDDEKLLFADLIFYNGLGLEHGPSLHYHLQHNPKAIALGDQLATKLPEKVLFYQGQVDPHIWMDLSLWAQIAAFISNTLGEKDPAHASLYESRANLFIDKLLDAHREIREQLTEIPEEKRYLVTSHDAFNYFARAYLATEEEQLHGGWQKRFAAPEGLAPESQLSAVDIQFIINHLAEYHIQVLFPESNISKDSIRKIINAGNEKGLHLRIADGALYGDAMGSPGSGGDSYLKMMRANATLIKKHLLE